MNEPNVSSPRLPRRDEGCGTPPVVWLFGKQKHRSTTGCLQLQPDSEGLKQAAAAAVRCSRCCSSAEQLACHATRRASPEKFSLKNFSTIFFRLARLATAGLMDRGSGRLGLQQQLLGSAGRPVAVEMCSTLPYCVPSCRVQKRLKRI